MTVSPPRERPILFSADMVRAVLSGAKTQTRRVVMMRGSAPDPVIYDRQPRHDGNAMWLFSSTIETIRGQHRGPREHVACPYGAPGDRLWVREGFYLSEGYRADSPSEAYRQEGEGTQVRYVADNPPKHEPGVFIRGERKRPSIHMPRWASRINLEITDVRVERVQEISERDAVAEGIEHVHYLGGHFPNYLWHGDTNAPAKEVEKWAHQFSTYKTARGAFSSLWQKINGARGYGWEPNPYVWAVSFRVLSPEAETAAS